MFSRVAVLKKSENLLEKIHGEALFCDVTALVASTLPEKVIHHTCFPGDILEQLILYYMSG